MSNSLFRKKSIQQIQADAAKGFADAEHSGGGLRRTLGVTDLTLMGMAAIIGAGIFAMVGQASYDGGPAVIFLFVFTGITCAFSALCYAEFASRIPVAGSAYTYSYASLGELVAWIIGWDLIVEYAIGNIAVAISWSDYFTGLLKGYGIIVPQYLTMDYLSASRGFADGGEAVQQVLGQGYTIEALSKMNSDQLSGISDALSPSLIEAYLAWTNAPIVGGLRMIADFPALVITLIITALVFIGIREAKWASNAMTILKTGVILMVIFVGFTYVNPENWSPFAPNGVTGVLKGVAAVFFAYIGFDALSTTAEECKDPHRDLPRAIIYSLIICTVLYILLALVLTGMVSYTKLNVGDPLAFVFGAEGANIPWIAGVIAISAVVALATVFLVFQIGQPRLWMAMSRDGLLPRVFSSIHPKYKTPWFATIVTGFVVAIPALFMNLSEVTDLASIGTLFAFAVVCAGVLVKEKEFQQSGRRFVPYINSSVILPVLVIIGFLLLIYFNGISKLNENAKSSDLRISAKNLSEIEEDNKYAILDMANITNPAVYVEGLNIFNDFFTINTESEERKLDFVLPKQHKSLVTSKERIFVVNEDKSEREIIFTPDTQNAKTDVSHFLAITPFVSGQEINTANSAVNVPIQTENGDAKVTITQKQVKESWLAGFSHKIPLIVFILLLGELLWLSVIKKLSLIPTLGVLSCAYLMTELGWTNWFRFGLWLLVGLVIYFAYGRWNSNLNKQES